MADHTSATTRAVPSFYAPLALLTTGSGTRQADTKGLLSGMLLFALLAAARIRQAPKSGYAMMRFAGMFSEPTT